MNQMKLAREAIELLTPSIKKLLSEKAKREDMHIVVMDPTLKPWECSFEEAILYEHSMTDKATWANPYDEIAREKAQQAWRDGESNMHKHLFAPATLKSGESAYYGSFEYEGVIVASSGVESWFDVLISGWVALTIQQLAQDEYNKFKANFPMERYIQ
jgi:hypothetical protein